jgi:hemoglobin
MSGRVVRLAAMLGSVMAVVGCPAGTWAEEPPSLYQRLGGREGIALVVEDFVAYVVADDRINARFKAMKPEAVNKLKSNVADFVCDATGGPCAYVGKDMKSVHAGMNVTEAEWDATVEDLVKALDKRGVGEAEKTELLGLLAPLRPDILGQ